MRDITRKLPSLVQSSDCYRLLLFYMGGDEVAVSNPRVIKRDFRALGHLVGESGAQVIFTPSFQLRATMLQGTGGSSLLIRESVACVTDTTLAF